MPPASLFAYHHSSAIAGRQIADKIRHARGLMLMPDAAFILEKRRFACLAMSVIVLPAGRPPDAREPHTQRIGFGRHARLMRGISGLLI